MEVSELPPSQDRSADSSWRGCLKRWNDQFTKSDSVSRNFEYSKGFTVFECCLDVRDYWACLEGTADLPLEIHITCGSLFLTLAEVSALQSHHW